MDMPMTYDIFSYVLKKKKKKNQINQMPSLSDFNNE